MEAYFDAQCLEADSKEVPDLDSYIRFRRDASGCKPYFTLIEYANGLNLPDRVFDEPIVRVLQETANDIVSWSNVSSLVVPFFLGLNTSHDRISCRIILNTLAEKLGTWSLSLWNFTEWTFKKLWTM